MRVYRHDPPPRAIPEAAPRGLGGWMILVTIGLAISSYSQGKLVLTTMDAMSPPTWNKLTTYGSSLYKPGWAPALLAELLANIALFVWILLVLVLLFRRRSSFPKLTAGLYVAGIAYIVCDFWIASSFLGSGMAREDWITLAQAVVRAAIWVPYLLVSRRVRATFVNTWRKRDVPPPIPANVSASDA